MPNFITAKVDLNKVLDQHLFQANSGARYLDIVLIPSKNSQYGDTHFIVQGVNKASRDKGEKGPIIGNAKEKLEGYQPDANQAPRPAPRTNRPRPAADGHNINVDDVDESDLPF